MNNGFLIAIEGIDGSGKSTLAASLAKTLATTGHATTLTKEPGGTQLGGHVRALVHSQKSIICDKAEFLLFAADRAQHFHQVVTPALQRGDVVISDRMSDSSLAYQGFGRGLDQTFITTVNGWATGNRKPDLVVYIAVPIELALQRAHTRGLVLSDFEKEHTAFWRRVAQGFEKIFANRHDVLHVDGTGSAESIHAQTVQFVLQKLKKDIQAVNNGSWL